MNLKFSYLSLCFTLLACLPMTVFGQQSLFELKSGDRVVFVGNSLFENDLQYGYLEFTLTTRWPQRELVFKNLGWTGDNVFGEARSYITNPPTAYELLIQQITEAKPTVVFIGYGGIEAQNGESGVAHFKEGYLKLLDKIDALGAESILLSPTPVLSQNADQQNLNLQLYSNIIAEIAKSRNKRFVDVFNPILNFEKKQQLTDNGFQLNEAGYYYLSQVLEHGLGLPARTRNIEIAYKKSGSNTSPPSKIMESNNQNSVLKYGTSDLILPLPLPKSNPSLFADQNTVKIMGLKKGYYKLLDHKAELESASDKSWAKGIPITQGTYFDQSNYIRQLIFKKNELFFYQYRPLNRTYIIGFRSYEQGKHTQELDEMNVTIKWLETQIMLQNKPETIVYELKSIE